MQDTLVQYVLYQVAQPDSFGATDFSACDSQSSNGSIRLESINESEFDVVGHPLALGPIRMPICPHETLSSVEQRTRLSPQTKQDIGVFGHARESTTRRLELDSPSGVYEHGRSSIPSTHHRSNTLPSPTSSSSSTSRSASTAKDLKFIHYNGPRSRSPKPLRKSKHFGERLIDGIGVGVCPKKKKRERVDKSGPSINASLRVLAQETLFKVPGPSKKLMELAER